MNQELRCAACGDKTAYDGPHECWVVNKIQHQESLPTICGKCFEPEVNGLSHWRCWEQTPDGQ